MTPAVARACVLAAEIGREVGELPLAPVAGLEEVAHHAAALVIGDVHR